MTLSDIFHYFSNSISNSSLIMSEIASSPKLSKKELEPYFNANLVRSKLHLPAAITLPLSLYFSSTGILTGASFPLILSWPKRIDCFSSHQRALLYIA